MAETKNPDGSVSVDTTVDGQEIDKGTAILRLIISAVSSETGREVIHVDNVQLQNEEGEMVALGDWVVIVAPADRVEVQRRDGLSEGIPEGAGMYGNA